MSGDACKADMTCSPTGITAATNPTSNEIWVFRTTLSCNGKGEIFSRRVSS